MYNLLAKSEQLVRYTATQYSRYLYTTVRWDNRLIGIKGARGTGKTTLLLQRLKSLQLPATKAAYFSLDDIFFTQNLFADVAEQFYREGGKMLFLDEVHKYPGWAREIKNLYDFFPDLQVVFTGSSIIDLAKEEGDLSRRALMYELQGLSFREYLGLSGIVNIESLSLQDLLHNATAIRDLFPADFRPLAHFRTYLSQGYYPFFKEDPEGFHQRLAQMVRVVVEYDMTSLKGFDPRNARKLLQLLFILSANVPYKPNLTQLAQKADVHRNTILNYLVYLENARLIRLLQASGVGLSLLQKPEKVYLNNTNLAYALSGEPPNTGNLRETFFISQMQSLFTVTAPSQGDFLVDNQYLFEIGGKQKTYDQIAGHPNSYVVRDDLEYPVGKFFPLWVFGCLY